MTRSPFQPTGDMNLSWRGLAAPAVAPTTDAPSTATLGDYELLEELGRGDMGVVYRARQRSLDREVALKLFAGSPWTSGDAGARFATEAIDAARMQHPDIVAIARFAAEATRAARIQHPNIIAIHEFGTQAERFFYSMELVQGTDLATHLRERGPMAEAEACRLVRELARAVHYAHGLDILHLDLKPQNVLMEADGRPRIADFGLACPLDRAAGGDTTETIAGTPAYMAPEQALLHAAEISPATDVYGLGTILYQCLTGAPPFQGESAQDTLRAVAEAPLVLPRSRRRSLSRDVEAVCLKCLQRDPTQRYASAEELAEDLGRVLDGNPVQARRLRWTERTWRWLAREPVTLGGLAGAAVILVLAAAAWYVQFELTRRSERLAADAYTAIADALLANGSERAQLEALVSMERNTFSGRYVDMDARQAFHAGLRDAVAVRRGTSHPLARELALNLAGYHRRGDGNAWRAALKRQGTPMASLLHAVSHTIYMDGDSAEFGGSLASALASPQLTHAELALASLLCEWKDGFQMSVRSRPSKPRATTYRAASANVRLAEWRKSDSGACVALQPRLMQAAAENPFFLLQTAEFGEAEHAAFLAALERTSFVDIQPAVYREALATLEPVAREVAAEDLRNGLSARDLAALAASDTGEYLFTQTRLRALLPCHQLPDPVPDARRDACRASIAAVRAQWSSWHARWSAKAAEHRLEQALAGQFPQVLPKQFNYRRHLALMECCSQHRAHPEWVRRSAQNGDLDAVRWLYRALGEEPEPALAEVLGENGS